MINYILRRLLLMIPVLIGVSIFVFAVARVLPGDVFSAQAATSGEPSALVGALDWPWMPVWAADLVQEWARLGCAAAPRSAGTGRSARRRWPVF